MFVSDVCNHLLYDDDTVNLIALPMKDNSLVTPISSLQFGSLTAVPVTDTPCYVWALQTQIIPRVQFIAMNL